MNYVEFQFNVSPKEPGVDILIAELNETGFDSFEETESGLNAYIPTSLVNETLLSLIPILNNKDFKITFTKNELPDKNWNEVWEKNFQPVLIGDGCCIRASFHPKSNNCEFDIVIDPKMSFGTGHHETTSLMVEEMMGMDFANKTVADAGCGTAVLAILASKRKANNVFAFDVDDWAVDNSKENIIQNNCGEIDVYKGGASLLAGKLFNVILANINKNVLLADIDKYSGALLKGGDLLLSGFYTHDKDDLIKEAGKYDLTILSEKENKNWCLLHFIKRR